MPNTIQECIDGDYGLTVWCDARNCTHGMRLDLEMLRDKLGPDHGAMHVDLVDKFRCTKCGSKKVTIRVTPFASRRQGIETWGTPSATSPKR